MKSPFFKIVKWMVTLGVIGVFGGAFLPFIGWEFFENSSYENFFMIVEDLDEYIWGGIMIGALLVTIVSGLIIDECDKMGGSIGMIFAAIAGEIGFRYYVSEVDSYFFYQYGIGRTVMEAAYIILIVAAVFALGIDFYCVFIREEKKDDEIEDIKGYKCPKCGLISKEKNKFCSGCGFEMRSFVCPKCGAERKHGALFCSECGEKLPVFSMANIDEEENKIRCEKCGHSFSVEERICPKCGTDSKIMV